MQTPRKCAQCGRDFYPKRADARTCSHACRVARSKGRSSLSVSAETLRNADPDSGVPSACPCPPRYVSDPDKPLPVSLRDRMIAAGTTDRVRLLLEEITGLRARTARLEQERAAYRRTAARVPLLEQENERLRQQPADRDFSDIVASAGRMNGSPGRLTSAEKTDVITELQHEVAELRRAVEAEHAARVSAEDQAAAEAAGMRRRMAALERALTAPRGRDSVPPWLSRMTGTAAAREGRLDG